LNASNGSRQARHRQSALQAVAPNALIVSAMALPHRGHTTTPSRRGGAIPAAASLRYASGVIQSVVQVGANTVRTTAFPNPARANANATSNVITPIAGHPE
jgi:hypothetical protein